MIEVSKFFDFGFLCAVDIKYLTDAAFIGWLASTDHIILSDLMFVLPSEADAVFFKMRYS